MPSNKQKVKVIDLGLIDYKKAWDFQEKLNQELVQIKLDQRKGLTKKETHHTLILCEHPFVYTLGKSGSIDNLKLNSEELEGIGATYYKINRGGDITHHGPGQLVAYPILDLEKFYTDIHRFLRELEDVVIETIKPYGIIGDRYPGYTGVWVDPTNDSLARKICAMGIRCSRWVTMHGIALNVNNDLSLFDNIIPCGIEDKDVTSIKKEVGQKVNMEELKRNFISNFESVFDCNTTMDE